MSKIKSKTGVYSLEKTIMEKIESGQVKMKPKWFFILGSISMIAGLAALFIISAFLVSLFVFSIRTQAPMAAVRYQILLENLPLWAPVVAVIGISIGIFMFKKYDFFYKRNFPLVALGVILSVILAGVLIDYLNLDSFLIGRGVGRKLYQRYDGGYRKGSGYQYGKYEKLRYMQNGR